MTRRWAIMGTGIIAGAMAEAVRAEGGELVAVGSGSAERAAAFAARYDVPNAHGHHHDVLTHDVEVVYVATTNDRHHLDAAACLDADVAALVEKPFALDHAKAESILARAERAGVFVAEAMWMNLQPGFLALRAELEAGTIGTPRLVQADFGVLVGSDPDRRWFAREQGGGALLDVGVYPLTLIVSVLGAPTTVLATGELTDTGVDAQLAVAMRHDRGVSSFACSFVADTGIEATVAGEHGSLRLAGPFHHGDRLSHRVSGDTHAVVPVTGAELRYRHEVREVHRCLDEGLTESPALRHADTLTVLAAMDEIRAQVGVTYPEPSCAG